MSTQPAVANVTICACDEDHVAAITTIYAHHVLHGLASFEVEPPSEDDMRQRRLDIVSRNYPYLVAKCAGEVVGYASASPYRLRPAYRHSAENSVYLHPAWAGRGIGRQLMSALLAECEARGLRQTMMKRLPTFSRYLYKSFRAGVSVHFLRRPHAILGFMRFAELDELYDLAPFFRHASLCLGLSACPTLSQTLLNAATTRVL